MRCAQAAYLPTFIAFSSEPPMISSCCSSGRSSTTLDVRQRVGHALGVREVGAEHEVVGRDAEVDEALRVGLVEHVHPHVAVEDLDRVLVEEHRASSRRCARSLS